MLIGQPLLANRERSTLTMCWSIGQTESMCGFTIPANLRTKPDNGPMRGSIAHGELPERTAIGTSWPLDCRHAVDVPIVNALLGVRAIWKARGQARASRAKGNVSKCT